MPQHNIEHFRKKTHISTEKKCEQKRIGQQDVDMVNRLTNHMFAPIKMFKYEHRQSITKI